MPNIAGGSVFASYVAAAYADTYPEVSFNEYIAPMARTDTLVVPAVQDAYVKGRCAAGQELLRKSYEGKGHMGLVLPGSPLPGDLLAWTQDRIASLEFVGNCDELT